MPPFFMTYKEAKNLINQGQKVSRPHWIAMMMGYYLSKKDWYPMYGKLTKEDKDATDWMVYR